MFDLKFNLEAFLPSKNSQVCILATDIIEPEILIRILAADTKKTYPDLFKGETPQVFYRMRYVPPYETFQEIRKLILQIRNATGIRSMFNGVIAIDVSEYKGHEEEEFFIVLLKYLYDNSQGCKILLVCSQYTEKEIGRLFSICSRFFPVQIEKFNLYDTEHLKNLIKSSFKEHDQKISSDNVELIADILECDDLTPYRTLQLIDRVLEELHLRELSTDRTLGDDLHTSIKKYFRDSYSPICLLAGHALLSGKEELVEHTL